MHRTFSWIFVCFFIATASAQNGALVFQTDFGLKDGAVSAMKGVAFGVSPNLKIFDNTHEIPAYDIWEAAYRLNQVATYWPAGTVFVSVVDPGVGSERKSVIMKSKSGHFFVTPDNGTLTLIAENLGVEEIRLIDEKTNRRADSETSYTFHGRDVYAYAGARLAAKVISFEQVGPRWNDGIVRLPYEKAKITGNVLVGSVDILDIQYGNVWTNIPRELLTSLKIAPGDTIAIRMTNGDRVIFNEKVKFGNTFSDVPVGDPIAYLNSLGCFSLAINQQNFANMYAVGTGPAWRVEVRKE